MNDLKSLHVPRLKDKRKPIQKYETSVHCKERISVDIPFLGISLMNSHPEVYFVIVESITFGRVIDIVGHPTDFSSSIFSFCYWM